MRVWEINPMEGPRQVPTGMFSRSVSRTSVAHLVNARRHPRQGFTQPLTQCLLAPGTRERSVGASCADGTQPGTHDRYAPADAYQHQVRTEVRTSGSHPLTRTKAACLLSKVMVTRRWFPLWFPPKEGGLTGSQSRMPSGFTNRMLVYEINPMNEAK